MNSLLSTVDPYHSKARWLIIPLKHSQRALHPKQLIRTPNSSMTGTLIDQSVGRGRESHFHAHLEMVTSHVEMCDSGLERIELLEREVTDMLEGWRGVEGQEEPEGCF